MPKKKIRIINIAVARFIDSPSIVVHLITILFQRHPLSNFVFQSAILVRETVICIQSKQKEAGNFVMKSNHSSVPPLAELVLM